MTSAEAAANFTAYDAGGFGAVHQRKLADKLMNCAERQTPALLSNADCPWTRELYSGLPTVEVAARRNINSNTVKYVLRAGRKGDVVEDLEKAAWYLRREIDRRRASTTEAAAR